MTSDVVPAAQPPTVSRTLGELLQRIDVAQERMSINNPHRRLLIECGNALVEFATKMTKAEERATAVEAPVETIGYIAPTPAAEPQISAD